MIGEKFEIENELPRESFRFLLNTMKTIILCLFFRYDEFLERLIQSDPEEKGITFAEFHDFCTFLNNLDDFAIAMKMYTLADRPVSESNSFPDFKY